MTDTATFIADFTKDPRNLAMLGEGEVVYVKPMLSEQVAAAFPEAPALESGLKLFALLSASGAPIMLTDSRDTAIAEALAADLRPVSLH
ncbi:MAG: DUF1150 domain-containing protein [Salinarimonadaceae bacterium]|nr:MAG: DUF1150 domain-containing protein [Salinarimonadaceae bacterium]